MKFRAKITVLLLTLCGLMQGCEEGSRQSNIPASSIPTENPNKATQFETKKVDGVWRLLKNGEVFYINGAATNRYYAEVKDWGGNVGRTYGVTDATKAVLDEAWSNGVYMNLGFSLKDSEFFDYSDPKNAEAIQAQYEKCLESVRRYGSHPAVLCWSIGNEVETGNAESNAAFFKEVERIAQMVHKEDPNHPTTIAFANSDVNNRIKVLMEHAPSIDILSINSYYPGVGNVATNMAKAGWDKPWMITEYGPRGTWNMSSTSDPRTLSWGALEEMTSTEKANIYSKIWRENIKPNESKGCIGSFIFLWGYQNHGAVLSWYGLFDKQKNSTGGVDEISECWTGKAVENPAPRIEDRSKMKLNGKTSSQNVKVASNSTNNTATVEATSPSGAPLKYRWIINAEGAALSDGSMPDGIEGLIVDNTKSTITFKAPPATSSGYRLYVFVTDEVNNKVAIACIPFLVE